MRAFAISVVLLAALVVSSASRAEEVHAVEKHLAAAVQLFEALEYERALGQLDRAKKLSRGPEDDVRVCLYEGIIRMDSGDADGGAAAFREALYLDPNAELPVKVSPKLGDAFAKIKAEALKNQKSAPPPATAAKPSSEVSTAAPTKSGGSFWWAPVAGGALLLGGSTVFALQAKQRSDTLKTASNLDIAEGQRLVAEGRGLQTAAFALGAAGVVAVGVGVAMAVLAGDSDKQPVAFVIGPTGAGLAGRF